GHARGAGDAQGAPVEGGDGDGAPDEVAGCLPPGKGEGVGPRTDRRDHHDPRPYPRGCRSARGLDQVAPEVGYSSSRMVTVASFGEPMSAPPPAFRRSSVKVSVPSLSASSRMSTMKLF